MKKVLITKIGLDGHEVGAQLIAQLLSENGFDVTYLGIRQTVGSIIEKVKKLKPDAIGVSIMTGGHNHFMPLLKKAMIKEKLDQIKLVCGGLIPRKDEKKLLKWADAVFSNDSDLNDVLEYFKENI